MQKSCPNYGFGGVSTCKSKPGLVACATLCKEKLDAECLYVSQDYGETWKVSLDGLDVGDIYFNSSYMKPKYNGNRSLLHWESDVKINSFDDAEGNRYITCINADLSDVDSNLAVIIARGNWRGLTKGGLVRTRDGFQKFQRIPMPWGQGEKIDAGMKEIERPNVNPGWVAMSPDGQTIAKAPACDFGMIDTANRSEIRGAAGESGVFYITMARRACGRWFTRRLRPYIRECMRQASETGAPVMRPLFFDFPQDKTAWRIEDAYMFGPDLLVAPVMGEGQRERQVYLPVGCKWTDANTRTVYEGGQSVTVPAPLDIIPVFVREGKEYAIYE